MLLLIIAFSLQSNKLILKDFTLSRTNQESFFDIYDRMMDRESNIIITSDLFFHSSICLYDSVITLIEKEQIIPPLKELLTSLYSKATGTNKDYFEVALSLLGEIEPKTEKVKSEIKLIESASRFARSKVLGIEIDYSQFKPRGHYTKSENLSNYFKAMMWLSFPKIPLESKEFYNLALKQATLIEELNLLRLYNGINSHISRLIGSWNDITPTLVLKYKDTSSPLKHLTKFRRGIVSRTKKEIIKYSFLPQRFILDSYIFQRLTYDYIEGYNGKIDNLPFTAGYTLAGIQRTFPRGLDFFSVLGSEIAYEILSAEGDMDYPDYTRIHNQLKREIKLKEDGSLYEIYLLALRELISQKPFVSPTYQYKNLITTSGAWSELRHATILYAKQSYTAIVGLPPKKEKIILIEPFPEVYRYLLEFAKGMEALYPLEGTRKLILNLETAISVSEKELDGEIPELKTVESIPYGLKRITGNKATPLIADVHTDPNTQMVLEEATGNPYIIDISLEMNHKQMNFRGVTYSYYEFKQPLGKRLTDEEWKAIMGESESPRWIERFIK